MYKHQSVKSKHPTHYGWKRKEFRSRDNKQTLSVVEELHRLESVPRQKLSRNERRRLDRIRFQLSLVGHKQTYHERQPDKWVGRTNKPFDNEKCNSNK